MLQFLLGLAKVEAGRTLRRVAATGLVFVLGGGLLLFALFALLVAAFIALTERYDPVVAALLVAAGAFAGAVILLLVAYLRTKSSPPRGRAFLAGVAPPAAPPPSPAVAPAPPASARTVLGVALGAALVGLILGRRL